MSYPDCYEPAEHRRALAKVLKDLKAIENAGSQHEDDEPACCSEEQAVPTAMPDPIVQVRSTCPETMDIAHQPVN